MGNISSDPLNHSFKRLRLSQTKQLMIGSPASNASNSPNSPKRKIASNIKQDLNEISTHVIDGTNDSSSPVLYHDDVYSSETILSTSESLEADINKKSSESFCFDDHDTSFVKSSTKCINNYYEESSADNELSDEEIIMCLRLRKTDYDLLDIDIVDCLKKAHINKTF